MLAPSDLEGHRPSSADSTGPAQTKQPGFYLPAWPSPKHTPMHVTSLKVCEYGVETRYAPKGLLV